MANVNNVIGPELIKSGLKVTAQKEIDDFLIKLDGSSNKGKLGANAILGVSIAVAEAGAAEKVCWSLSSRVRKVDVGVYCVECPTISTPCGPCGCQTAFRAPHSGIQRDQWWISCGEQACFPGVHALTYWGTIVY